MKPETESLQTENSENSSFDNSKLVTELEDATKKHFFQSRKAQLEEILKYLLAEKQKVESIFLEQVKMARKNAHLSEISRILEQIPFKISQEIPELKGKLSSLQDFSYWQRYRIKLMMKLREEIKKLNQSIQEPKK